VLLGRADFITVHVPLTSATGGLIGERELALLKPTARLINCARGGIVDESALVAALQAGQLAGVALDVFEQGRGPQGEIVCQVTGEQLRWLDDVLARHEDADHVVVMAHTPILTPVWKWSSSGLVLDGGRRSPLWQTMKRHGVDLYLCGEVHAITCTERDGVLQIAHGGLFGYNPEVSYLVATVSPQRIDLELKAIGIVNSGEKLWQVGTNRPQERVTIAPEVKKQGFQSFGTAVIDKTGGAKKLVGRTGLFDESRNPLVKRPVVEIKRLKQKVTSQLDVKSIPGR